MSSGDKQFLLYSSSGAQNGQKVSILLEEMRATYKIDYDVENVDITKKIHKQPWFIKLNPDGRIPVLVDRSRDNLVVCETAAILLYLAQHYDKEHKFSWTAEQSRKDWSEMLQWMLFAHGSVGPTTGEVAHFTFFAKEDIPYAKKRYLDELRRLYGVMEIRLKERDWLAGPDRGSYSIADINVLPFVRPHEALGITAEQFAAFPSLKAWLERGLARPEVQAGLEVPSRVQ